MVGDDGGSKRYSRACRHRLRAFFPFSVFRFPDRAKLEISEIGFGVEDSKGCQGSNLCVLQNHDDHDDDNDGEGKSNRIEASHDEHEEDSQYIYCIQRCCHQA